MSGTHCDVVGRCAAPRGGAYEICGRIELIELCGAELYRVVADRFPWSEPQRRVFTRLMDEELEHAARVRRVRASLTVEPIAFVASATTLTRLAAMEAALRDVLEEVESSRWDGDSVALKDRLADLELRLAMTHAEILASCADGRVSTLLRELAQLDREHLALVADPLEVLDAIQRRTRREASS
jgi:rubrerythrin